MITHQLFRARPAGAGSDGQFAGAQGGGYAAVHEEVGAGDERGLLAEEEGGYVADFVGGGESFGGADLADGFEPVLTGAGEFAQGERGDAGWTSWPPTCSGAP